MTLSSWRDTVMVASKTSSTIALTWFARNIPISAPDVLIWNYWTSSTRSYQSHEKTPLTRFVKLWLRMCRECRERYPHQRLLRKPLVSDPGIHHGTCVTHVPWCMSGLQTRGGRGKRSRHSRRMCNQQFYVSGKRPMCGVAVHFTYHSAFCRRHFQVYFREWKLLYFDWYSLMMFSGVRLVSSQHWFR